MIDGRDPSVNLQSLKFLFAFVRGGKKDCFETERERDGNFVRSRRNSGGKTRGTKRGKDVRYKAAQLFPGISCDGGRDFCFGESIAMNRRGKISSAASAGFQRARDV